MKKIRELLDEKGTQVWSIPPTKSVYDALALMAEKRISGQPLEPGERQYLEDCGKRDTLFEEIEIEWFSKVDYPATS